MKKSKESILTKSEVIQGTTFQPGSSIKLDEEGNLEKVVLGADQKIMAVKFAASMPDVFKISDCSCIKKRHVELNPNCSEVVFSLEGMTRQEALAKLAEIGIIEFEMPSREFWGFELGEPGELEKFLADRDNPNVPDFKYHSHLDLEDNFDTYGLSIVGHEDIQSQMFPTMLKIENAFHDNWHGYDGGSIEPYDQWAGSDESRRPIEDVQDDVGREKRRQYVGSLVGSAERIQKARERKSAKKVLECAEDPDSEI
jgi:hypothetical protein